MKTWNIILIILFASMLSMIQSCGDNGSGDDSGADGGNPSSQLNGGLKGYFLWDNYGGRNRKLVLSTGRWHEIPVIESWMEQNKEMDNIYNLYDSFTRFSNDGRFALKVIDDCDFDAVDVLESSAVQCVVVFDLNNQSIIGEFRVGPLAGRFLDSIALSDDGQFIAILDTKNRDYYRLRIYDLGGNKIDESLYADRLAGEFVKVESLEWLPDGRLIFSYGPAIVRTKKPFSTPVEVLKVFPKNQGEPVHLRVSPDGTKIAYALKTDETFVSMESTLWVMNVDGSNPYQLVESLGRTQPQMNNPAWSQDGKWIAFEFGGVGGVSVVSPGFPSGLLAIPSDAVKARVDYDAAKISPDIVRISSYYTPGRDDWSGGDHRLRDSFPDGRVTWVMP